MKFISVTCSVAISFILNFVTVQCDITREEDISSMFDTIGQKYDHIDILINNAGIAKYLVSEKISNQEMRQLFKVNFFWNLLLYKSIAPLNEA